MNGRKVFSILGWAYVVLLVISVIVQSLIGTAAEFMPSGWQDILYNPNVLMVLSQASMYLAGFPVFYYMIRRLPVWRLSEKKTIRPGQMIFLAVFCLGFSYIGSFVGNTLMTVWDFFFGIQTMNPVEHAIENLHPAIMILTTVIVAPIMEELLFRKFLIDRIIPYGQKFAVIISGIGFGFFHGNLFQFFYAWILGMIFAYIYSSTGKIKYNIFLHMFINITGGLIPLLLTQAPDYMIWLQAAAGAFMGLFMLVTMTAAASMLCLWLPKLTWTGCWGLKPGEKKFRELFKAPGVWAFLLVCAVEFLIT